MPAVPQHVWQGDVDPPLSKAVIVLTTLQTWPAQWYHLKVVKTLRKTHLKVSNDARVATNGFCSGNCPRRPDYTFHALAWKTSETSRHEPAGIRSSAATLQ